MVIPGMGYSICFCWDGPYLLKVSGGLDLLLCWLKILLNAQSLPVKVYVFVHLYDMQLTQIKIPQ